MNDSIIYVEHIKLQSKLNTTDFNNSRNTLFLFSLKKTIVEIPFQNNNSRNTSYFSLYLKSSLLNFSIRIMYIICFYSLQSRCLVEIYYYLFL